VHWIINIKKKREIVSLKKERMIDY
jgi:hypothetical protein